MKEIGVGLLGFGTVGAGVAEGLLRNHETFAQRVGCNVILRKIADLDITRDRGVAIPEGVLTTDAHAVIADPNIQIIVELIGGTGIAKTLMLEAIRAGKAVVTANKKLLAEYGEEIFAEAKAHGVDLYFGASVGGSIPIIRVLRNGLAGNEIESIHGILNGTCNYILTRMDQEHLPFDAALSEAQRLGYAEADPSLDIDGFDTAHKAIILASLAYGFFVPSKTVSVEGIRTLSAIDVQYAAKLGYCVKLLATITRDGNEVEVGVHPTLVPHNHMLASVTDAFNAVMVHGDLCDDTLYYGRGAGRLPTASTVIGDIGDIARTMRTSDGKPRYQNAVNIANTGRLSLKSEADISSKFYVRLMVEDRAGTFGQFGTIFGKHHVSISIATSLPFIKGMEVAGTIPVVIQTHHARHADLLAALDEIYATGILREKPVYLRMI